MALAYIAVLVFILFSIAEPAGLLLTSKLMRINKEQNSISKLNFESAEESVGKRITIMSEYFHYFSAFLAFEIIVAVILIWAGVARSLPKTASVGILMLALLGFAMEGFVIIFASKKEEG